MRPDRIPEAGVPVLLRMGGFRGDHSPAKTAGVWLGRFGSPQDPVNGLDDILF